MDIITRLFSSLLLSISLFAFPISSVLASCSVNITPSYVVRNTNQQLTFTMTSDVPHTAFFLSSGYIVSGLPKLGYELTTEPYSQILYRNWTAPPGTDSFYVTLAIPTSGNLWGQITDGASGECSTNWGAYGASAPYVDDAPTPASGFDTEVKENVSAGIASFSASSLTKLAGVIPLALLVLISILLVFKGIHWFMEIASGKKSSLDEQFGGSFNSTSPKELKTFSAFQKQYFDNFNIKNPRKIDRVEAYNEYISAVTKHDQNIWKSSHK